MAAYSEVKKVLVLCQRSHGTSTSGRGTVEDLIVPLINDTVHRLIGEGADIEYLTDNVGNRDGGATYVFTLDDNPSNEASVEFIASHESYYSLIILNTCPLIFMDYWLISRLLKPDGSIYFANFPTIGSESLTDLLSSKRVHDKIAEAFDPVPDTNMRLYIKKQFHGEAGLMRTGKISKRRKVSKRRKTNYTI